VIIICGISLLGWPEFLYKIESAMAFLLIMIIFLAYYLSFKEMREALAQHTKGASMRIQIFYLILLLGISILQMIMSVANVFGFGFWDKLFGSSSIICRLIW
jgi:hypothetical protein